MPPVLLRFQGEPWRVKQSKTTSRFASLTTDIAKSFTGYRTHQAVVQVWATAPTKAGALLYDQATFLLGCGGFVPASRAPWWFYILAVSFLSSFPLMLYNRVWGPGDDGLILAPVGGYLIVKEVQLEKPAGRAGMRAGDRILNVDGIPTRGVVDYLIASADFESGRPIAAKIERKGKPAELTMTLPQGSLGGLRWNDWVALATAILTFVLALVIGVRRPREPAARICSWFMASFAMLFVFVGVGWTSYLRHLPRVLGLLLWPSIISSNFMRFRSPPRFTRRDPDCFVEEGEVWEIEYKVSPDGQTHDCSPNALHRQRVCALARI